MYDPNSKLGKMKMTNFVNFIMFFFVIFLLQTSCVGKRQNQSVVVTSENDSISIGEELTIYKMPYAYDHSIIYNVEQRKWHLYGIEAGNKTFIHLTADSLTQQGWKKHKPFAYKKEEIWAPHIIENNGFFYMFFTNIGVPREICLSISKDLFEWEDYSEEPLFAYSNEYTENQKNKDPMVFWDELRKQWIMYFSMMKDDKHWVVGYSVSTDLVNWKGRKICFDEQTEEPGVESPFVVKRGDFYYLFLSARPWPHGAEEVFRSETSFLWESEDLVKSINPWHAAEVVQNLDGKWYLSRSSGSETDFRLAPLFWNDGIED